MNDYSTREGLTPLRFSVFAIFVFMLASCVTQGPFVPETNILSDIQVTLDEAAAATQEPTEEMTQEDTDILDELIPSLSLDESLLAPIEERISITSPSLDADIFFNSLVAETQYGVVISEDVDVQINLSLPNVTIEEAMDTVAEIYNLDISRRGNIFTVRPGGLRTRQFSIDYLNVQRQGTSSIQVTASNSQGQGGGNNQNGGFNNGGFNNGGNFNGGNSNNGNFNGNGNGNNNGNFGGGQGGGGAGGNITTSTSTDFWSDLETALSNLIGVEGGGSNNNTGNSGGIGGGLFGGIGNVGAQNQSRVTDEGKSILVQPTTGIIIVTAYPHELDRIETFLDAAQETLRREVIIQVQFIEVVLNKGFQYAIDFNTFGQQANDPVTGSGMFDGTAEGLLGSNNSIAGELTPGDIGIASIGNPLQISTNFGDFDAVFDLLESRGTAQIISSPQLRVLNNQKAVFQDGEQEYFQTQSGSTTVTGGDNTTTNANNALEQFFSGISMDITPQISAGGEITLHIHPTITAVSEQSKLISGEIVPLAKTTTREMDSIIKAENGKIVVLGGLAFEKNVTDSAGIPVINDIPLLGDALEQKQEQSVKSEFIILLKPIMANPEGDRRVLEESNERFADLNRAIDPFANN